MLRFSILGAPGCGCTPMPLTALSKVYHRHCAPPGGGQPDFARITSQRSESILQVDRVQFSLDASLNLCCLFPSSCNFWAHLHLERGVVPGGYSTDPDDESVPDRFFRVQIPVGRAKGTRVTVKVMFLLFASPLLTALGGITPGWNYTGCHLA